MAMMTVNVLDDNTELVKEASDEAIKRALTIIGLQVENYAKANTPVDTGALRNSITSQVIEGENAVEIGSNMEYAPYVELGTGIYTEGGEGRTTPWAYQDEKGDWHFTRGQKPQPFLRPAIIDNMDEFEDIVRYELENA